MNTTHSGATDFFRGSDFWSGDGLWSGSEGRQHEHYVALIPISRYDDAAPRPAWCSGLSRHLSETRSRASKRFTQAAGKTDTPEFSQASADRMRQRWADARQANGGAKVSRLPKR